MLIKLDFQSELPIYLQLKQQIIEGMVTGKLQPGEALPSVRQLAADLGINLHTVNKTYNLLRQDGFVTIHRQKGVVIGNKTEIAINGAYLERLRQELRPMIAEALCRGLGDQQFHEICCTIYQELRVGGK